MKNLQENSVKPSNLEGQADPNLLIDFELLLMSVIPHRYFISFLQTDKPNMLPYLQVIHLCKLYQDDLIQYHNLFDEKMNVSTSNTKELT